MLLQAARRPPRVLIVPRVHPANAPSVAPLVAGLPSCIIRKALAADAIVAVAPEHAAVPTDLRTVLNRLECFCHAPKSPTYATLKHAAPRFEHNGEVHLEPPLAGAAASRELHAYDLFNGLHQFADFGGLIVCVVPALSLGRVSVLA